MRSTHRILREGSFSKIKMCVSLQRRAIKNFQMYFSLQQRAQKCMKFAFRYSFARSMHRILGESSSSKIKKFVSLQRRAIKNLQMYVWLHDHEVTNRLPVHLRFTTFLDVRRARSEERVRGRTENLHFTRVLSVRGSLFALRVAWRSEKFAFHQSFERPRITFCVKGCLAK